MPEICRFYGVTVKLFWFDHNPPHFHAEYGDAGAVIDIRTLAVLGGELPGRALGMVVEWAADHREELLELWAAASVGKPLWKIDPLH